MAHDAGGVPALMRKYNDGSGTAEARYHPVRGKENMRVNIGGKGRDGEVRSRGYRSHG